jgi:S1-C subfamily serine protease
MYRMLTSIALVLFFMAACTSSQSVVQSGAIYIGMSKEQLRDELLFTSYAEDPFLSMDSSRFLSDIRMEILATPSRTFFFVFTNVDYPSQGNNIYGNGILKNWFPTENQALQFVEDQRRIVNSIAPPPATTSSPTKIVREQPITPRPRVLEEASSGSGFAVSYAGHYVTNYHVIESCDEVQINQDGERKSTIVITRDEVNDLALIKADLTPSAILSISNNNPQLLSEIYAAGFPYGNSLSTSIKVTRGIVSSLVGLGNNSSEFQIDAAIQPGNSGGPIVDSRGSLIGVAVASLDQQAILERFGSIPQNTNFGIKSNVLGNLLSSNNVSIQLPITEELTPVELGQLLTDATVYISCLRYD